MDSKTKVKLGIGVGVLVIAGSVFVLSSGGMFQGSTKSLMGDELAKCERANAACIKGDKNACSWQTKNKNTCDKLLKDYLAKKQAAQRAAAPSRANNAAAENQNHLAVSPQTPTSATFHPEARDFEVARFSFTPSRDLHWTGATLQTKAGMINEVPFNNIDARLYFVRHNRPGENEGVLGGGRVGRFDARGIKNIANPEGNLFNANTEYELIVRANTYNMEPAQLAGKVMGVALTQLTFAEGQQQFDSPLPVFGNTLSFPVGELPTTFTINEQTNNAAQGGVVRNRTFQIRAKRNAADMASIDLGPQDVIAMFDGQTKIATTSQYEIAHANGIVPTLIERSFRQGDIFHFTREMELNRQYTVKLMRGAAVIYTTTIGQNAAPVPADNDSEVAAIPGHLTLLGATNLVDIGSAAPGQHQVNFGDFQFSATNEPINIQAIGFKAQAHLTADTPTPVGNIIGQVYLYNGDTPIGDPQLLDANGNVVFTGDTNLITVAPGTTATLTVKADVRENATLEALVDFYQYFDMTNAQTEFQIQRTVTQDAFSEPQPNNDRAATLNDSTYGFSTRPNLFYKRENNGRTVLFYGNSYIINNRVPPTAN